MQIMEQVKYTLIQKHNKAIIKITDTQNNTIIRGDKTIKTQHPHNKTRKNTTTGRATITEISTTTKNKHTTITHLTIEEYTPHKHKTITIRPDRLIIQTTHECRPRYEHYGCLTFRKGNGFWVEKVVYVFVDGVTREVVQELC